MIRGCSSGNQDPFGRMDAQCKSADALARWLTMQPWASEVFYPGLENHEGHDIIKVIIRIWRGGVRQTRLG